MQYLSINILFQNIEFSSFSNIFGGLWILVLIYFISLKLLHRATSIVEDEHEIITASDHLEKEEIH
jgi:hypothetical protein